MIRPFYFASTPCLHFGAGKVSILPTIIKTFGPNVLLVTGAQSFRSATYNHHILKQLRDEAIAAEFYTIDKEPTPEMIDLAVSKFSCAKPDVVLAIGGGSALDAGKAIAAMLPLNEPVKDYLEGVGTKVHPGVKTPLIAVPTTAGTGSEATKNAVLSEVGVHGYKRSLRHNNFVPDVAIIDPELTVSCPPATTAASGMDAFTQLLESYLSTSANSLTDALAYEGLKRVSVSLLSAYHDGANLVARTNMAMASYLSGITLANAGLGLVHGFASSIGGYFEIPHGVICSSLMYAVNKITVRKLRDQQKNHDALLKYAAAGKLFAAANDKSMEYYIDSLLETIASWATMMQIPRLSQGGLGASDFEKIVDHTDNKNNPVALDREEMLEILEIAC